MQFVLTVLFVITLASDRAILSGNVAFSILVPSTKKQFCISLEKVYVFQKNCFKVKALKTFKICRDYHIKTSQSLKRRASSYIWEKLGKYTQIPPPLPPTSSFYDPHKKKPPPKNGIHGKN